MLLILLVTACGRQAAKSGNSIMITQPEEQAKVFGDILTVTRNAVPEAVQADSLAFLILPVQASCPACRKKAIDSIVKHRDALPHNRFIVISARGGYKTINSYFREQGAELPVVEGRLFLDSSNRGFKYDLFYDKPMIYYTANKRVYKKIEVIPATVKENLHGFFSGIAE